MRTSIYNILPDNRSIGSINIDYEKSPFLAWGYFHARSLFARPTIPEEKWGTTRSLYKYNGMHMLQQPGASFLV